LGVAALSAVAEEQKRVATLELKISYFAPAFEGDLITGKGMVLKKGNRIVFSEGELFNQNHQLIAKGSGTFTAYPIQEK
jgi:acyl-CoA thioesterase